MIKAYGGLVVALLVGALLLAPSVAQGQGSPTPSRTPTLSNDDRIRLSTIAPPKSCGMMFMPCGPLPFNVPKFPTVPLPSPTEVFILSNPATETPHPSLTPQATNTPTTTATSTQIINTGPMSTFASSVSQLGATLSFQSTQSLDVNGTQVSVPQIMEAFGQNIGAPLSFVRAIQYSTSGLGIIGSLINLLFIGMVFVIFVRIMTLTLPVIISLFRLVMQVIQTLKPF